MNLFLQFDNNNFITFFQAENLKEELGDVLVSIPKKSKMVYIESSSDQENTDKLNLSRAQASRRRNSTITALKPIHCTSSNSNNNESVMDGMWATLVSGKSTAQLCTTIKNSKTCISQVDRQIDR